MKKTTDLLDSALRGEGFLLFDGAMGTMLQRSGLKVGDLPEMLSITSPDVVTSIHRQYVEAGSQVVSSNTFGANSYKMGGAATVDEVFGAALACARNADPQLVAADIGPIGSMMRPLGPMSFDEVYDLYAEQALAVRRHGADLVIVETMNDLLELKAAILAFREYTDLPIIASMTFGADGRTFMGVTPECAAITLDALGVAALGVNCSLGPDRLLDTVQKMRRYSQIPVIVQANAGLPRVEGDRTVYDIGPESYAESVRLLVEAGATIIGGCCGTDPAYIAALSRMLEGMDPGTVRKKIPSKIGFAVCGPRNHVVLEPERGAIASVGERINPNGKPRMKAALRDGDYDYLVGQALEQADAGAHMLDVNVGLPEIDEVSTLVGAVERIQAVCDLPLMIDSTEPEALEQACRRYNGKPLINSCNGSDASLEAVLPIARKYGCALVGLTLDEGGVPKTAEERLAIARKIVDKAMEYGIRREDIAIDCLTLSASSSQPEVLETLKAVRMVKGCLGVSTTLGVSNVSFGLPNRSGLNAAFLSCALGAGLDLPIVNVTNADVRAALDAFLVFNDTDRGASEYIARYAATNAPTPQVATAHQAIPAVEHTDDPAGAATASPTTAVREHIVRGRASLVAKDVEELLADTPPIEIVNTCFIPALDEVGARYENGTFFLPQLMAAAEAAQAGFEVIRSRAQQDDLSQESSPIVLATVKGDVHDIGKNIVRMLLGNYGFKVVDLGKDVDPEDVVRAIRQTGAKLVGLSALMTTTVKSMQKTIDLIRREGLDCQVMVGGAVLNPEYARMVGADFYCKDAAESARVACEVLGR